MPWPCFSSWLHEGHPVGVQEEAGWGWGGPKGWLIVCWVVIDLCCLCLIESLSCIVVCHMLWLSSLVLFAMALLLLSLVIHRVCCLALPSGSAALILVMPCSQYQFYFSCLSLKKTMVMLANPQVLDPWQVTVTLQENLQPVDMVYTHNYHRYGVMGHRYRFGKPYPRVTPSKKWLFCKWLWEIQSIVRIWRHF